jgi:hypothetical protein
MTPSPRFFVSAESKGVRFPVSRLEGTLVGSSASVDSKGVEKMSGKVAEGWVVKPPRHMTPEE